MTLREFIAKLEEFPEKYKDQQIRAIGDFAHDLQWRDVSIWEPDVEEDAVLTEDDVVTLYWDGVERR